MFYVLILKYSKKKSYIIHDIRLFFKSVKLFYTVNPFLKIFTSFSIFFILY